MKQAIHCKTQEEFNKVLEIFEKKGWKWMSGETPLKNLDAWDSYREEFCVRYEDKFGKASINWYKEEGYQIISFEEFLKLESQFKVGECYYIPECGIVQVKDIKGSDLILSGCCRFYDDSKTTTIRQTISIEDFSILNPVLVEESKLHTYSFLNMENIVLAYWCHEFKDKGYCSSEIKKEFIQSKKKNMQTQDVKKEIEILEQKLQELKKQVEGKLTFVKVIQEGLRYSTHPNAKEYGCTNYHYWINKPSLKNGDILEVVKEITINSNISGYILKDKDGVEYIIEKAGVVEVEEPKSSNTPKFKEGQWVYTKNEFNNELLFRFTKMEGNYYAYTELYHIDRGRVIDIVQNNKVCNDSYFSNMAIATKDQIERILKVVAEYKGFKEGVIVYSFVHNRNVVCNDVKNKTEYLQNNDKLHFGSDGYYYAVIYHKGKWAEIIKEYSITVDSYKSEINKQKKEVKFGCKILTLEDLKAIKRVCELNKQFENNFIVSDTYIEEEYEEDRILNLEDVEKLIEELEK